MKLKQHIEASKMKLLVLFTASYCFKERNWESEESDCYIKCMLRIFWEHWRWEVEKRKNLFIAEDLDFNVSQQAMYIAMTSMK